MGDEAHLCSDDGNDRRAAVDRPKSAAKEESRRVDEEPLGDACVQAIEGVRTCAQQDIYGTHFLLKAAHCLFLGCA